MTKVIKYGRQFIDSDDIESVINILKSDWLTQGPAVPKFEDSIARKVGAKFGVATNSATSALHIAYLSLGLKAGDILWSCPNSFVATTNAAIFCGAEIDFVDIDPDTFNIDIEKLKLKLNYAKDIGRLPKIVVPVHIAGQSPEMEEIHKLSKEYNFKIVEDASHSIGGKYKGNYVGNCKYSDITVFSFHPVKIITTGEGGIALTNDNEVKKKLILHRSHGITSTQSEMQSMPNDELWNYQQIELGYNYRMTDIAAGLGISQLDKLDSFVNKRHEIAQRYDVELQSLPLKIPKCIPNSFSSYHLYVIRLKLEEISKSQKAIHDELIDLGIMVNLHYIPIYRHPFYQNMGFKKGYCPFSEAYFKEALSIPIHPGLTNDDQTFVIDSLSKVLK